MLHICLVMIKKWTFCVRFLDKREFEGLQLCIPLTCTDVPYKYIFRNRHKISSKIMAGTVLLESVYVKVTLLCFIKWQMIGFVCSLL